MQTAIQNWSDHDTYLKSFFNDAAGYAYNPREDMGESGGMTSDDIFMFLKQNCFGNAISCYENVSSGELSNIISEHSPESNTFMAGVCIWNNGSGYQFCLDGEYVPLTEKFNHALELTNINDGYIDAWSWGKELTTVNQHSSVKKLIVIGKTEYAKEEKAARKELKCGCSHCTYTNCDICM